MIRVWDGRGIDGNEASGIKSKQSRVHAAWWYSEEGAIYFSMQYIHEMVYILFAPCDLYSAPFGTHTLPLISHACYRQKVNIKDICALFFSALHRFDVRPGRHDQYVVHTSMYIYIHT